MKRIETITYQGNCPRCGKEQTDRESKNVDVDCWDCSVNANLERHDIIRDIEKVIEDSDSNTKIGLSVALDIVRKYDK